MHINFALFCCLFAFAVSRSGDALAADGDLDPAFGNSGLGSTTFTGAVVPISTAVLSGGKLLIAAEVHTSSTEVDVGIARFDAGGNLDTSFSFNGQVLTDFGGNQTLGAVDEVRAMAVQADGKIVVCGGTYPGDFGVTRLNPDGSLDTSFGGGTGKLRVAFDLAFNADDDVCRAIAVQSADNKIVLAGSAQASVGQNYDFAIARLNPDGSLDTSFNGTGKRSVAFDFAGSNDRDIATSVAIDAQGGIVVAGIADHGTGGTASNDMAVVKLLANGDLDNNFNTDGKATVAFDHAGNNDDQALAMLLQRDGKILLVGAIVASAMNTSDFAAARLFPDGSLDTTYGPALTGKVRIPFDLVANGTDAAHGAMLQSDGKLVLCGYAQTDATHLDIAFARLGPKGFLDSSFGTAGKSHFSATLGNGTTLFASQPRLQNGRIVAVVGDLSGSNNGHVGVVRLQNDLIFADSLE